MGTCLTGGTRVSGGTLFTKGTNLVGLTRTGNLGLLTRDGNLGEGILGENLTLGGSEILGAEEKDE